MRLLPLLLLCACTGRYVLVPATPNDPPRLLDAESGNTWVLCRAPEGVQIWCRVVATERPAPAAKPAPAPEPQQPR